jgi:hypothetical protein
MGKITFPQGMAVEGIANTSHKIYTCILESHIQSQISLYGIYGKWIGIGAFVSPDILVCSSHSSLHHCHTFNCHCP